MRNTLKLDVGGSYVKGGPYIVGTRDKPELIKPSPKHNKTKPTKSRMARIEGQLYRKPRRTVWRLLLQKIIHKSGG